MIKLIVSEYYIEHEYEHETFEDAAFQAAVDLEWGQSYPVKIIDGDKVLWEHDDLMGDALENLRSIAAAANNAKS